MVDVFFAYASADGPTVGRMAAALEKENFTVGWEIDPPPGRTMREFAMRNVEDARCVVVIWSKNSVNDEQVREESGLALDAQKLIAARIDESLPPVGFRRDLAVDLADWNGEGDDAQWQILVRDVRNAIGADIARDIASARKPRAPGPAPAAAPPPPQARAAPPASALAPPPAAPASAPGAAPAAAAIAARRPPYVLIGVVAGLATAALAAFVFMGPLAPLLQPHPAAATAVAPQAQGGQAETAQADQAAADAEIEKLRAERDEAVEAQREAEAAVRTAPRASTPRVVEAPNGAARLNGQWAGIVNWGPYGRLPIAWQFRANGVAVSSQGGNYHWRLSGNSLQITGRDASGIPVTYAGVVNGNRYVGTANGNGAASKIEGTFVFAR